MPSTHSRTRQPSRASFSASPMPIQSAAPVGDDDVGSDIGPAGQHLPGVDDVAVSRPPRSYGQCGLPPVAMTTASAPAASTRARVTGDCRMHCHAGQFHLAREVGDDAAEFGAPRQKLRQQRLAAELRSPPRAGDLVAALGSNRGRLHAGGSAAGDDDPLSLGSRVSRAVGQLAAGLRMLDAGDRIAHVEMADAGLVAGDAGADVVEPPFRRLAAASRDRRSSRASCRTCRPGRRRAPARRSAAG